MAKPVAIVIPGLLGSGLFEFGRFGINRQLWYNTSAIIAGAIQRMKLGDDGMNPPNGSGVGEIQALSLLKDYYGKIVEQLTVNGWDVREWPYDWRLSLDVLGTRLLGFIKANQFGPGGANIVAHSMGGLVARHAYRQAVILGQQGLFGNMVTLGTPHSGSFNAVRAFTRFADWYLALWAAGGAVGGFAQAAFSPALAAYRNLSKGKQTWLDEVFASWPSVYQLLPSPYSAALVADTTLYKESTYHDINTGTIQKWFDFADAQWVLLDADATKPPQNKIVCVAGIGNRTALKVARYSQLDQDAGYVWTEFGDGVVPLASAELYKGLGVQVAGNHEWLPSQSEVLASVDGWLRNGVTWNTEQAIQTDPFKLLTNEQPQALSLAPEVIEDPTYHLLAIYPQLELKGTGPGLQPIVQAPAPSSCPSSIPSAPPIYPALPTTNRVA